MPRHTGTILKLLLVGMMVIAVESCSAAEASVVDTNCSWDVGIIDGKLDYGYSYNLTVENVGQAGNLTFQVTLSTSDGEWDRKQTLLFKPGETRTIHYFFHEPTVNSSNAQCRYRVLPF